jgi:hypothetical protein
MPTTQTPYMLLELPVVGPSGQLGPTWATNLNTALTSVDSHDHTTGKGVKITPSAININQNLTIGSYSLTDVKSLVTTNQSSVSTLQALYSKGSSADLYWNDASGNIVRLTSGGAVNVSGAGNISGMGSTTAALTYNDTLKAIFKIKLRLLS